MFDTKKSITTCLKLDMPGLDHTFIQPSVLGVMQKQLEGS
jgi:hypothetical protein